ncbi:hypothetical protein GLV94_02005 [Virgibacillus halodenitrificans]|uniref:hypothetical protein n=1 Tax=Virgibacillus halodenitrificans TaxID=1482 RepID=UPI00136FC8E8|nr:hypothetical protein [Virgibacillus halodenitrificans]MYL44408.1 hypothetical protein [Virgibacillus halodenitrificans]
MINRYQAFDTGEEGLYIGIRGYYFNKWDAKEVYEKSLSSDEKDDSIMIEVGRKGSGTDTFISIGVIEGEQLALALLNLCNSIKG